MDPKGIWSGALFSHLYGSEDSLSRYDALVLGGGPAGASTAYFLARAGWNVAIVEKSAFPRRKVCGEFIAATSQPLLWEMGVGAAWAAAAGPEIKKVGLFIGHETFSASMPCKNGYGRVLSRSKLDLLLIQAACDAGAILWQPWKAFSLEHEGELFSCSIGSGQKNLVLQSRLVIAAHGSWEPGTLPTQVGHRKAGSDQLAFKYLFRQTRLSDELMPLIAFPGGYGGMACSKEGLVGLSVCIRRDILQERRVNYGDSTASQAVLRHICETTEAVSSILEAAIEEPDSRISAGPIRPGIRFPAPSGIFAVGNAGGEAYPVIAEGISMALQGGKLLAQTLVAHSDPRVAAIEYHRAWRDQFSMRMNASKFIAHLAMSKGGARLMAQSVRWLPHLLTIGASLSGKTKPLALDSVKM